MTPFKRRHPALKFDDMHSDRIHTTTKRRRIPIWSEAKATQPREFEIRAIRPNEVHAAASMHFEFLGGPEVARCSFLKLGFKFLEAFYRLNLDNPYFFALGAFMRGELIGLLVFTTDRRKMFKYLLQRHCGNLLFHFLVAFLRRPIPSGRYLIAKLRDDVPSDMRRVPAVLLLMLVRPEARTKSFVGGTGLRIGKALIEATEAVLREKGCRECWMETTVDNGQAYNLARGFGGKCVGEAVRQGVLLRFIVVPVGETLAESPQRTTAA